MKRVLLTILVVYLLLAALINGGVLDAFLSLILTGAIPGTNTSIPASAMLAFWTLLGSAFAARYIAIPIIRFTYSAHKPLIEQAAPKKTVASRKSNTPRRRYAAIYKSSKSLESAK